LQNLVKPASPFGGDGAIGIVATGLRILGQAMTNDIDLHGAMASLCHTRSFMDSSASVWGRAASWCAAGSAVAVLFSIAVSHVLLGASFLCLLIEHIPLRFPPIKLPLALFFAGTVAALLLSPDIRAGLPQLKKFYVYLLLLTVYTSIRRLEDMRRIIYVWATLATASGLWSFVQFWRKREAALAAGHDFYLAYVASRVTGFMSHWMTFSAEMMISMLMLVAVLFFAPTRKRPVLLWTAGAVLGAALVIALTRSVWLATAAGMLYLVAVWRPKALLLAPVVLGVLWLVSPASVRQRAVSIYRPHSDVDSNQHRYVTRRVGWEMIKAHPWFGIGPDMVGRTFISYLPADIRQPLPDGFYGHLHNFYLQYAADRGVPTLAALLWMLGLILWDFVRGVRRLAPEQQLHRALLHGAIAAIIGILIEGLFEYNLGDSEVLAMFLVVVAWGYTALRAEAGSA
jgi:O-antigen ligase